MKRFALSVCLVVMLPAWAEQETATNSVSLIGKDTALQAGERALRAGDIETAIERLLVGLPRATSKHNRVAALSNLCAAYSQAGKFDESLEYCARALELKPSCWQAWQNRSRSLIGKGDYESAIDAAEKGLEIAPKSVALKQVLEAAQRLRSDPYVIIDTFDREAQPE